MATRRIRAGGGLATDPAALDQPEGLRVAENVSLHRPGSIQPRPGFGDTTGIEARTTGYRPIAIVPFDGDLVVQSYDGSAYRLDRGSADTQYTGTATPPSVSTRGASDFAEARGTLYLTTSTGIRALEDVDDAATRPAGVGTNYSPFEMQFPRKGSATQYAVGTESAVAYRYCWVVESGGYVKRSAPSSRLVSRNDSTTDAWVVPNMRTYLPDGIGEGARFELYRTVNVTPETNDPGDEMFLATVHTVTAEEETAGYIESWAFLDATMDTELGQALYTNSSQQGLIAANETPPMANSLAQWNRCLWLGNTTERGVLLVEVASVFDVSYPETWRGGAHYSAKTCATTNGLVTITPTSVAGLKVGQYVSGDASSGPTVASSPLPALAKIVTIKTVVTITNNADIQTTVPADYLEFTGVLSAASLIGGTGDTWQRIKMSSTLTAFGEAEVGADATETAANIATAVGETFDLNAIMTATPSGATIEIVDAGGHGVPVTVSEFVAGTFTVAYEVALTAAATATDAAASLHFHDFITVNGVEFFFSNRSVSTLNNITTPGDIERRVILLDNAIAGSETALDLARKLAVEIGYMLNRYATVGATALPVRAIIDDIIEDVAPWYLADTQSGPTTIAIVSEAPGGTVTFDADPRPTAFRPTAEALTSNSAARSARLWFSKPDEAEAFPLTQFMDVGDSGAAVLALTALDDALLIWKTDGLYSVTGSAPFSWVVDEVDSRVRLIAPQAVCVLDGVCFALTDRGVVAATAGGVQVVSGPIAAELRLRTKLLPLGDTGHKRAFWMTAHQRLGVVVLGVGASSAADTTAAEYVFHARAGGRWSKWTRRDRCAAYDPAEDRMVVGEGGSGWQLTYERATENDSASYYDGSIAGLTGTVASSVITVAVADFGVFTPKVGDVVYDSSKAIYGRITARDTSGSDWLLTISNSSFSASLTFTWYQSIACAVEWQPQHIPGAGSRWQEIHVALEGDVHGFYPGLSTWTLNVGGTPAQSTSASTVAAAITQNGSAFQTVRTGVPRAIVRANQMGPRIEVNEAGVLWRASELALHFTPQSPRVRR